MNQNTPPANNVSFEPQIQQASLYDSTKQSKHRFLRHGRLPRLAKSNLSWLLQVVLQANELQRKIAGSAVDKLARHQ
jgi:hypothetical protein